MFLNQLKVSLLLTSFDSPLTFKEHITKLSTLEIFDESKDNLKSWRWTLSADLVISNKKHNRENKDREHREKNYKTKYQNNLATQNINKNTGQLE